MLHLDSAREHKFHDPDAIFKTIFNIYNIKSKGDNSLEHIVPQSI